MKIKFKSPEKYTSRDLMQFWYKEYEALNGSQYAHRQFGGFELKSFKELLEDYNIYALLLAIREGIQNGESTVKYFSQNIERYLPDTVYPKYFFLIKELAPRELKTQLLDLSMLETKWFPSAKTIQDIQTIIDTFDDWMLLNDL